MSRKFPPALAIIALGANFAMARGTELSPEQMTPLSNLDRFASVVTGSKVGACFAAAEKSPDLEATTADGLLRCRLTPNFTEIQAWTDKTELQAHSGQPNLILTVSPTDGNVIVLVNDAPGGLIPAANDLSAPRRTALSKLRGSEFRAAAPSEMGRAVAAMEQAYGR